MVEIKPGARGQACRQHTNRSLGNTISDCLPSPSKSHDSGISTIYGYCFNYITPISWNTISGRVPSANQRAVPGRGCRQNASLKLDRAHGKLGTDGTCRGKNELSLRRQYEAKSSRHSRRPLQQACNPIRDTRRFPREDSAAPRS